MVPCVRREDGWYPPPNVALTALTCLRRLTQVQHSNAEVEWRLHALNRQILDAQGAVQQLCL